MTDTDQPAYATLDEVAARTGLHIDTVRRWAAEGRIAAFRLGDGDRSPYRITRNELDRLLAEGPREADPVTAYVAEQNARDGA